MENERLAKVETNIENIKEDVTEIKDMLNTHVLWEEKKYSEMERRYASKWVEKVLIGVILLAVGAVISLFRTGMGQ